MSASVQEPPASAVCRHGQEPAACMHEGAFLGLSGFNRVLVELPKRENAKSGFGFGVQGCEGPTWSAFPCQEPKEPKLPVSLLRLLKSSGPKHLTVKTWDSGSPEPQTLQLRNPEAKAPKPLNSHSTRSINFCLNLGVSARLKVSEN